MKHIAECPACFLEFETSIEAADAGLGCPNCNTEFRPDSLKQVDDTPLTAEQIAQFHKTKIITPDSDQRNPPRPLPPPETRYGLPEEKPLTREEQQERQHQTYIAGLVSAAELLGIFAVLLFIGSGCLGLYAVLSDDNHAWAFGAVAGSGFFLALWVTLFKHLNYIRAALEKR